MDDSEIMQRLKEALAWPAVTATLSATAERLLAELRDDPGHAKSTFSAVPLDVYGDDLPPGIGSAWLFALRKGFAHPPERHPESIQRMFALKSSGRFEVWQDERWVGHMLDPGGPGLSIPADAWHRAPALDEDWVVASFHTAAPDALIEIVGDPASGLVGSSRVYLAGS
jgi:hypothetical protein